MRKKKSNHIKILGKWYPKIEVKYAGTLEKYKNRDDLELVNDSSTVKTITKKCFGNHPDVRDFAGYLINRKDACIEAYGFVFPHPYPSKTVYKVTKG